MREGGRVELIEALRRSRELEARISVIAGDARISAIERGRRISALIAEQHATPIIDAWVAAGRPEPLGFRFNASADHAEWFDAWVEVESVVLDGLERGYSRDELEGMILANAEPFDLEFEAEDLGIIHRHNEPAHTT